MERLVQTQGIAHAHQGNAHRAAEVTQHLPDKFMQFCFVHRI
jgi:hypothetical protein